MIGHCITFTGTSILNSNLGIEDINFGLAGISIWNFILFWAHDYFHIFSKIYPVIGVIYFIFCIFHLRSAAPWKHPAKRSGAFDQNHEIGFSGNLIEVSSAGNSIYIYSDFSTRNQLPRCLVTLWLRLMLIFFPKNHQDVQLQRLNKLSAWWPSLMYLSLIFSLCGRPQTSKTIFWDGENLRQKIKETKWVCWRAHTTLRAEFLPQIHRVQRTAQGPVEARWEFRNSRIRDFAWDDTSRFCPALPRRRGNCDLERLKRFWSYLGEAA